MYESIQFRLNTSVIRGDCVDKQREKEREPTDQMLRHVMIMIVTAYVYLSTQAPPIVLTRQNHTRIDLKLIR